MSVEDFRQEWIDLLNEKIEEEIEDWKEIGRSGLSFTDYLLVRILQVLQNRK